MYKPFAKLHVIIVTIFISSFTLQPIRAGIFEQDPTTDEVAQLVTALAGLPASLLAQEYPDSNALALLEHVIKAGNGYLALYNQTEGAMVSYTQLGWFAYDCLAGVKNLTSMIWGNKKAKNLSDQPKPNDFDELGLMENHNSQVPTATLEEQNNPKKRILRAAGFLLASIETVIHAKAALNNKKGAWQSERNYHWFDREFWNNLASTARVAHYAIRSNNGKWQIYLLLLLVIHGITIKTSYNDRDEAKTKYQDAQKEFGASSIEEYLKPIQDKLDKKKADGNIAQLDGEDGLRIFKAFWGVKQGTSYIINQDKFPDDMDQFCRDNKLPTLFTTDNKSSLDPDFGKHLCNQFLAMVKQQASDGIYKKNKNRLDPEQISIELDKLEPQTLFEDVSRFISNGNGPTPGFSNNNAGNQPPPPNQRSEQECLNLLELPADANLKAIQKQYRRLALQYAPDKNPDNREEATKKMQNINEAYRLLLDKYRANQQGTNGVQNPNEEPKPTAPKSNPSTVNAVD